MSEAWDLDHQTFSAKRSGTMFDVRERPCSSSAPLLLILYQKAFLVIRKAIGIV